MYEELNLIRVDLQSTASPDQSRYPETEKTFQKVTFRYFLRNNLDSLYVGKGSKLIQCGSCQRYVNLIRLLHFGWPLWPEGRAAITRPCGMVVFMHMHACDFMLTRYIGNVSPNILCCLHLKHAV